MSGCKPDIKRDCILKEGRERVCQRSDHHGAPAPSVTRKDKKKKDKEYCVTLVKAVNLDRGN